MANIETTLVRSGIGTKDSNAALAAEVFATLEATNGNSAQAKSLVAIIQRAESRLASRLARKAAKAQASGGEQAGEQASEDAGDAPAPAPAKSAKRVRTIEVEDAAAVEADAPRERDFVARMREIAARNEREGIRT